VKKGEPITKIVRSLRSGQITIPAEFRRQLGIDEHSLLQLTLSEGELRIKPMVMDERTHGSPWLKDAYDAFAAVRSVTERHSDQDIDEAIEVALKAVRAKHA
jgi:AbrB family looped-hinge helix DNA binding protein